MVDFNDRSQLFIESIFHVDMKGDLNGIGDDAMDDFFYESNNNIVESGSTYHHIRLELKASIHILMFVPYYLLPKFMTYFHRALSGSF